MKNHPILTSLGFATLVIMLCMSCLNLRRQYSTPEFRVALAPKYICLPGEQVTVVWSNATDGVRVTTTDNNLQNAQIRGNFNETSGQFSFPANGGEYVFVAGYGGERRLFNGQFFADQVNLSPNGDTLITFDFQCPGPYFVKDSIFGFSNNIRVSRIENLSPRAVSVLHNRETVMIEPMNGITLSPVVPIWYMNGIWSVTTALRPTEGCAPEAGVSGDILLRVQPRPIQLRFHYYCERRQ